MEEGPETSDIYFDSITEKRLGPGIRNRPTGKDKRVAAQNIMLIDEFGDKGDKKHSSDFFGVCITITDQREKMEIIVQKVRGKKIELKSGNATEDKKDWVITRMARLKPEAYGVYVDKRKKDLPEIWVGRDRTSAYRRVIKTALKDALKQTETDDLIVLIDYDTALMGEGRKIIDEAVKEAAEETGTRAKRIKGYEEVDSKECDAMQAHDFVTGALRDHVLGIDGRWVNQLGMKFRRLVKR